MICFNLLDYTDTKGEAHNLPLCFFYCLQTKKSISNPSGLLMLYNYLSVRLLTTNIRPH